MSIFEHFRKEEHPFIERAMDWFDQVDTNHTKRITDFLDPRQVFILQTFKTKFKSLSLSAFGGYLGAERCRAVIRQEYEEHEPIDFGITAVQVTGQSPAFQKLEHKDFLGALLSCGLKREKFGDILLQNGQAQIIMAKEVMNYVRIHLVQVHRVNIVTEEISLSSIQSVEETWKKASIVVPSNRADVVVGEVFHLSRAKVLQPIRAGHLKVNWMVVDSPSFSIKAGDMVSLRGFGRFKVFSEEGQTRKGNLRFDVGLLR